MSLPNQLSIYTVSCELILFCLFRKHQKSTTHVCLAVVMCLHVTGTLALVTGATGGQCLVPGSGPGPGMAPRHVMSVPGQLHSTH